MKKTKNPINKQTKNLIYLFSRYIFIILLGLGNLAIFYKILTPLTTKTVVFVLNLFSPTHSISTLITFKGVLIQLVPACIAGAAYYLLFILIFSTPKIKPLKRIHIVIFSFVLLFILNVSRILILTFMNQSIYFETTHLIFWYGLSTVFVFAIWIITLKIFKIKYTPVYQDIRYLVSLIKKKK